MQNTVKALPMLPGFPMRTKFNPAETFRKKSFVEAKIF
jgi:hypothetical protein